MIVEKGCFEFQWVCCKPGKQRHLVGGNWSTMWAQNVAGVERDTGTGKKQRRERRRIRDTGTGNKSGEWGAPLDVGLLDNLYDRISRGRR